MRVWVVQVLYKYTDSMYRMDAASDLKQKNKKQSAFWEKGDALMILQSMIVKITCIHLDAAISCSIHL